MKSHHLRVVCEAALVIVVSTVIQQRLHTGLVVALAVAVGISYMAGRYLPFEEAGFVAMLASAGAILLAEQHSVGSQPRTSWELVIFGLCVAGALKSSFATARRNLNDQPVGARLRPTEVAPNATSRGNS